jgi:hypothetical protein
MPLHETEIQVESDVLGHFYAVMAMDPNVEFYRLLKDEGIPNPQVRWAWFCLVAYSVSTWIQELTVAEPDRRTSYERVFEAFSEACSASGISTEDVTKLDEQSAGIAEVIRARLLLEKPEETAFDFGLAFSRINGFNITNPARLVSIEQIFWGLFHDVRSKLAHYALI